MAADGSYSYTWDTTSVAPGTYYVAGYLWNGANTFTLSHLTQAITITAPLDSSSIVAKVATLSAQGSAGNAAIGDVGGDISFASAAAVAKSSATVTPIASTSSNWSGYAASAPANSVSYVAGSWVVPTASSKTNGYSSVWVGIDGYNSSTVEQIGDRCGRDQRQSHLLRLV